MSEETNSEIVELEITDVAYEGKGVGKKNRFVYFIHKTMTGDRVRVRTTKRRKNFSEGIVQDIINPAPDRIEPPCQYYTHCGGCHYMHIPYTRQLEIKREHVIRSFERIAGLKAPPVESTVASKRTFDYRNRSVFHVKGKDCMGFVSLEKNSVLNIDECLVCKERINLILKVLKKFIKKRLPKEKTVNHVSMRVSDDPEMSSIIFGVDSSIRDNIDPLIKALHNINEDVSVHESITPIDSNMTFSESVNTLHGLERISFDMLGFKFQVSPLSFFQINPFQAQKLAGAVMETCLDDLKGKRLLDLYCGVGLFSLPAAKLAAEVQSVDSSRTAISDAIINKEFNKINNVNFVDGKASQITQKLAGKGQSFDTAIIDPPRGGAAGGMLRNLGRLNVETVIYVSCNPATLARDAKFLKRNGYSLKRCTPFDMFPQTYHIETLSVFERD